MTTNVPAWTALDSGALPLPTGAPGGAGRVMAIVATESALEAGWAGKCAVGLARAWAGAGHRVVLADASVTTPTLHRELGVSNGEGLTDILLWGASVRRVAQGIEDAGFYLVSAGTAVADPGAVLEASRWRPLCDGFRDAGVTLAVFLPHDAPSRDAALARAAEVIVVAAETEDVSDLAAAAPAPVVGVVGDHGEPEGETQASDADEAGLDLAELAPDADETALDMAALAPEADETPIDLTPTTPEPEEAPLDLAPPASEPEEPELSFGDEAEIAASPADEEVVTGWGSLEVFEGEFSPEAEEPVEEAEGTEEPDAPGGPEGLAASDEPLGFDVPLDLTESMEPEVPEAPAASTPEPEVGAEEPDAEEAAPGAESADAADTADGGSPSESDADQDAELVDPLSLVDPLPAFRGTDEEIDEDEAVLPPRVPPLEEVLEAAESGAARPAGRRRALLWVLLVALVGLVAAALLGYVQIPGIPALLGAPVETSTSGPAETTQAPAAAPMAEPPTEVPTPARFDVALGAYQDAKVAAERVSSLGDKVPGLIFTSVPVTVRGTLYHRVLAGPAADSAAAAGLVTRIAEATGLNPSSWVIRETPKAFLLGETAERDAADRRVQALERLDVPAYVLAVDYSDASVRYRVYAGSFADETEASSLSSLLKERGLDGATLSDRIGRLPE